MEWSFPDCETAKEDGQDRDLERDGRETVKGHQAY
jgi:hypothetical protein